MPVEVMTKPKQGFQAPIAAWLRSWIAERDARPLFPALTQNAGLLDEGFVNAVLREHQNERRDHGTLIMMLITLDLWYGIFVDGAGERPTWTWRDWLA